MEDLFNPPIPNSVTLPGLYRPECANTEYGDFYNKQFNFQLQRYQRLILKDVVKAGIKSRTVKIHWQFSYKYFKSPFLESLECLLNELKSTQPCQEEIHYMLCEIGDQFGKSGYWRTYYVPVVEFACDSDAVIFKLTNEL